MNAKTAEKLLPCFHPGQEPEMAGAQVQKAVRFAKRDDSLRAMLEAQKTFDEKVEAELEAIDIPPQLRENIVALGSEGRPDVFKLSLKNPAVLAAILSLTVVAVLVARTLMERAEKFPGKEAAQALVESMQEVSAIEFEPINPTPLGELNDWFAMNGMEHFVAPPEFAKLKAVGCRVQRRGGIPIAQALVDEQESVVYVFRGNDLGVKLDPSTKWRTFTEGEWAAAIRPMGELCFMVTFRGTKSGMERFLARHSE